MAIRWQSDGTQMALRWHSDGNQMAVRWHSDGNPMASKTPTSRTAYNVELMMMRSPGMDSSTRSGRSTRRMRKLVTAPAN